MIHEIASLDAPDRRRGYPGGKLDLAIDAGAQHDGSVLETGLELIDHLAQLPGVNAFDDCRQHVKPTDVRRLGGEVRPLACSQLLLQALQFAFAGPDLVQQLRYTGRQLGHRCAHHRGNVFEA